MDCSESCNPERCSRKPVQGCHRIHPPCPVICDIDQVICSKVGLGKRVKEHEVKEGQHIGIADAQVPCDGEQGKIGASYQLCKRETLVSLSHLVKDLDTVTAEHDQQDECRMRKRKGRGEEDGRCHKDNKYDNCLPGRDQPLRNRSLPKHPPVLGQLSGFDVPGIVMPVNIVIEDKPCFKSKETDERYFQEVIPREETVYGSGKEVSRAEEDRPCKKEMEPQEIHITSHDLMHTGIFNTIIIQVLRWMAEILIGAHEFTTVSRREANAGHLDNPVTGRRFRYRPRPFSSTAITRSSPRKV